MLNFLRSLKDYFAKLYQKQLVHKHKIKKNYALTFVSTLAVGKVAKV